MSETAILLLINIVKKRWKKDNVITFLQRKDLNLDFDDENIGIIKSKKVNGKNFFSLMAEKLENYGLQSESTSRITELVKKIKNEQGVLQDSNPEIAFLQKEIEDFSLRIKSDFRKVYHLMEVSSLLLGFVTETELDKNVLSDRIEIDFLLAITKSTKPCASEKFSETPSNKSTSEKEIQDYFMTKCKVLKNYDPIKNKLKLTVEDTC
ncbi:kinase-like domain-containing protein [Rhizophagus clarus]|uniref:Kinase-like domain-containing protein n=1 Tax=Rhizophagus clarus TaxID=94130 RepID=A0A8H3L743_9GLOM|nr:kinase-like domain-containing protein [Rhizophagus clarus]